MPTAMMPSAGSEVALSDDDVWYARALPILRAVVGFTVLALTACADDGPGRPASPQVTAQAPDDLFVSTARRSGALDAVSDSTILAAGREVCAALDRGVSPIEVLSLAIETGDTEGGVAIIGSAGSILCREHLPALEQLADQMP